MQGWPAGRARGLGPRHEPPADAAARCDNFPGQLRPPGTDPAPTLPGRSRHNRRVRASGACAGRASPHCKPRQFPSLRSPSAPLQSKERPHLYLDGWAGSGKSVALYSLVAWARANGWLALYLPSAFSLVQSEPRSACGPPAPRLPAAPVGRRPRACLPHLVACCTAQGAGVRPGRRCSPRRAARLDLRGGRESHPLRCTPWLTASSFWGAPHPPNSHPRTHTPQLTASSFWGAPHPTTPPPPPPALRSRHLLQGRRRAVGHARGGALGAGLAARRARRAAGAAENAHRAAPGRAAG